MLMPKAPMNEDGYPLCSEYDIGPAWSFLYGVHAMGFAADCPAWMEIRQVTKEFKERSGLDAVPFLKVVGDADVYCFDARGDVVRWDHETNALEPQQKSFAEVFEFELAALKARKERKKSGGK